MSSFSAPARHSKTGEIEQFEKTLIVLWESFLKDLDEYEKDPYRNHYNFWERDESFGAFMHWLSHHIVKI
jgi:hypothetical protein